MTLAARVRALVPRRQPNVRARLAELAGRSFSDLDPAVVDAFLENYGWTLPLSLVQQLVGLVRLRRPAVAIEFGCGVSTLALCAAQAEHGGLLVSFEENVEWIGKTQQRLAHPERVVFATVPRTAEREGLAHRALASVIGPASPGMVLIDGPAHGDRFDEEAWELYRRLVTPSCIVALDDTDRPATDDAARRLATEFSLVKHDFGDPMFERHRYSLLLPLGVEPVTSAATPPPE